MKNNHIATNKTYELKTYQDFMNLTDDQFDHMIEDFKTWKRQHTNLIAQMSKVAELMNMPITEIIQLPDYFTWIDDNEHTGEITTRLIDQTGETLSEFVTKITKND